MKTKTKTLAVVEIAIVLCSILLVSTLPAIGADQTDEPLGIYGNANEDDTIDMRDTTYIKLVIFGKKPKTDLADANNDGKVSMLDVGQTKLIILGKEKKLTFLDFLGEAVMVNKPVKSIVIMCHDTSEYEAMRTLNAADMVVGVDNRLIENYKTWFPKFTKLPNCGRFDNPDYEVILSLNPDVLIVGRSAYEAITKEKLPDIPIIYLRIKELPTHIERMTKLGYILDKEEEAEEYINWRDGWWNNIKSRTKGLSKDEKPRVVDLDIVWKGGCAFTKNTPNHAMIVEAGGKDIAEDLVGGTVVPVDPEWIITQDPDVILIHVWTFGIFGYGVDDPTEMKAMREEWMNRPEFVNLKAVKTGRVFLHARDLVYGAGAGVVGITYFGKWFHPDLFRDIDPQAIHQEYIDKFQRIDFDLDEHGIFWYPPLE